jgi:hypothetical protein
MMIARDKEVEFGNIAGYESRVLLLNPNFLNMKRDSHASYKPKIQTILKPLFVLPRILVRLVLLVLALTRCKYGDIFNHYDEK